MNKRSIIAIAAAVFVLAGILTIRAQVAHLVEASAHEIADIARKHPIDPATGRSIAPVANGKFSSTTVWQFQTGTEPHLHREHDEVIYCEQGEGIALIGTMKRRVKAGDILVIPPGVAHGVSVTSKEPMRGISVFSPTFDDSDRVPVSDDGKPISERPRTSTSTSTIPSNPVPLVHAHAHNDYVHERPLQDALDHGFCSVEADVWLVDGRLLVAHDRNRVKKSLTLEALYLDPLRERILENGGQVYKQAAPFFLLIDVKSDKATTYAAIHEVLSRYADIFTLYRGNSELRGPITAILTGNRDAAQLQNQTLRYIAFDGEPSDLKSDSRAGLIRWMSASWFSQFNWNGIGPMPDAERIKLHGMVAAAHQKGWLVRFWGAPDRTDLWREERAAGVDLLNIDDLDGGRAFLLAEPSLGRN